MLNDQLMLLERAFLNPRAFPEERYYRWAVPELSGDGVGCGWVTGIEGENVSILLAFRGIRLRGGCKSIKVTRDWNPHLLPPLL